MEHKKVTAYDLNVGDRVQYDGAFDTVTAWRLIPDDECFSGEVELSMQDFGDGIFNGSEVFYIDSAAATNQTQYIRILEAIAGTEAVEMARNISEALQ